MSYVIRSCQGKVAEVVFPTKLAQYLNTLALDVIQVLDGS